MAVYRYVHTTFWDDTKVQEEMTPVEKYFMLYLLTNTHTKQCGVYEIRIKQISFETGLERKQIEQLLDRFENELNIIKYDVSTNEILILNWYKYNWTASSKVRTCIFKELQNVKSDRLLEYVYSVCIPYIYPNDTLSIPNRKEKEIKEKEIKEKDAAAEEKKIPYIYPNDTLSIPNRKENVKGDSCVEGMQEIIEYYNQNIGPISPTTAERLQDYIKEFKPEEADSIICEAINRAVANNVRKPNYIYSILDDWVKKNYKTLADVKREKKSLKRQFEYNTEANVNWNDLYDN